MDNALMLRDEVNGAIRQRIDPIELATRIYPRMEMALELAQTPQETNEIRAQIETVTTYIKRALPGVMKERHRQFEITHPAEMLYIRASAKAGQLWEACEDKAKHGGDRRSNDFQEKNYSLEISVIDAGFKGSADATTCKRIGELDEEDIRTFEEETLKGMKQPTLYGLERVWKLLNESNPPEPIEGKYRVFYADPPWSYGNTMPEYAPDQGTHYRLMSIDDICSLNVREAAEDDAVLFLWVTSPILEDAFKVINAWGFEYKASFVWDKVKHNMGHYNSVRHELLLVCTRGSCQPDVMRLFDSVVSIERTEHSAKPE